MNSSLVKGGFA